MYRALYDYKTDLKRYLSFETGDQFTVLDVSQKDWFLAQNGFGQIGYIPKNYVVRDEVSQSEVLQSIDRAIEVIHYEASSKGGQYTHSQRENLKKLIEHRENVLETYRHPDVKTTQNTNNTGSTNSAQSNAAIQPKRQSARRTAPPPPSDTTRGRVSSDITNTRGQSGNTIDDPRGRSVSDSAKTRGITGSNIVDTRETISSNLPNVQNQVSPDTTSTSVTSSSSASNHILNQNVQTPLASVSSAETCNGNMSQDYQVVNSSANSLPAQTHKPQDATDSVSMAMATGSKVTKSDIATSPFPSPAKASSYKSDSSILDCRTVDVPGHLGNELVEQVRHNTGLSYKKSCIAVETILGSIGLSIPESGELMDRIYKTLSETSSGHNEEEEESSSDYERLCEIFTRLTACKDDSQQRGWALHEDEQIITDSLDEMLSILENAKQSVSRRALAIDDYEHVHNLVQYYQLENRVKLRLLLLRVFGAMCTLDSVIITMLLCSVLTTELADELQQNIEDVHRSSYVGLVLTMIFAMGEPVPANLHDHLNASFLGFVFDTIENPPSLDHEDQLTDVLVNFILAFNLHCLVPKDNLVLRVIEEKKTVKVFTEKILLLFNRDDDPVAMFDHQPKPANSVMKMLQDMYSRPETSFILYTNDAKVLIDIMLRHLIDLSAGDQLRSAHLRLMQLYLENADYNEHRHRYAELNECLHRIQAEEENTGDDKHIVNYIFTKLNMFND